MKKQEKDEKVEIYQEKYGKTSAFYFFVGVFFQVQSNPMRTAVWFSIFIVFVFQIQNVANMEPKWGQNDSKNDLRQGVLL